MARSARFHTATASLSVVVIVRYQPNRVISRVTTPGIRFAEMAPFRNRPPATSKSKSRVPLLDVSIMWTSVLLAAALATFVVVAVDGTVDVGDRKPGTVFVALLVRNKAHTLPYFFSAFESLDYPKDRIHLW